MDVIRKVGTIGCDQRQLKELATELSRYANLCEVEVFTDFSQLLPFFARGSFSALVIGSETVFADQDALRGLSCQYADIPFVLFAASPEECPELLETAPTMTLPCFASAREVTECLNALLEQEADGGIMHNVSPAVFLQFVEMEQRTCSIRIVDAATGQGGMLYFCQGELFNARVGKLVGCEAAYKVFSWEFVSVFLHNACSVRKNIIQRPLQSIIMMGLGMKDESSCSAGLPDGSFSLAEEENAETDDRQDLLAAYGDVDDGQRSPVVDPVAEQEKQAPFADIQSDIIEVLERENVLRDMYSCADDHSIYQAVAVLPQFMNLGALKMAFLDDGNRNDKVIVAGSPPVVLELGKKTAKDKILKTLEDVLPDRALAMQAKK